MENASEICSAIGSKVMDTLTEAAGAPIATLGHTQPDGTFEFLLGPVYLPHTDVSLAAPTETRQLLVNVRLEHVHRTEPRAIRWMVKRGDEYVETGMPDRAMVMDDITAPPGEDIVTVKYHLSR